MSDTKQDLAGDSDSAPFIDGTTRTSRMNGFDRWYYGIEDRLGQGTVGMGVCFILFILVVVLAALFHPI